MATTYDALVSGENVAIDTCITIEGFSYVLTTGSATSAVAAYAASDWTAALSGVSCFWKLSGDLHPWEPFRAGGGNFSFAVQDADGLDVFGIATHKKTATGTSILASDVSPAATTATVLRSDDFASAGHVYVGAEAIKYDTNDTGTETFDDLTRGFWSPFTTSSGARFARSHRVNSTIPGINLAPDVTDIPTEWVGKWVAVRLHRRLGSTADTVAESHLAYVGQIASVRDSEDGQTVVECKHVLDILAETPVFREPWKASLREGVWLRQGVQFTLDTQRVVIGVGTNTGGSADPLLVVPSSAAGAYEIDEGFYTAGQVQFFLNRWMAAAYAASDTVLATTFTARINTTEGIRSRVEWSDGSAGSAVRSGELKTNASWVAQFFGWDLLTQQFGGLATSGFNYSANEPTRIATIVTDSASEVEYNGAQGSWFDQDAYLPTVLAAGGFTKGIVKVGGSYYLAGTPTAGVIELRRSDALNKLAGVTPAPFGASGSGVLEIQQVLVLEGSFFGQFLAFLFSTGAAGFNSPNWDVWPEHVGLGIPYSIFSSSFEAELAAAPSAGTQRTTVIEKATTFADLFEWAFTLRHLQPVWGNGRVSLTGWATPTSGATLTITEAMKHVPVGQRDNSIPVAEQSDRYLRNVIKIDYDRLPFQDTYQSSHTIDHKKSQNASGARPITIKARDAVSGGGLLGENLSALLPSFIAGLSFLTRPIHIVRVPVSFSQFITHSPGQTVLFTDTFLRDPSTGTRGVTGKPALIIGAWYDWGGGETNGKPRAPQGELTLMLFPGRSLAPYTATAHVQSVAAGGGGTSVVTCHAHRYSESSDPVDVSRFAANYIVRIRERDPSNPAAPQEWQPVTVVSVNAGANTMTVGDTLAGFDPTKNYVVEFSEYTNLDPLLAQDDSCFQADDADALVQDLREAYAYAYFGVGQVSTFTAADPATDLPERHVESSFGDGAPLSTGDAFAIARNLNNAVNYGTAPQPPVTYSESGTFGSPAGSQTWRAVRVELIDVGKGIPTSTDVTRTRKLYAAPIFHSSDGADATVRLTLLRDLPSTSEAGTWDLDRPLPYQEASFTDTSTSDVFPTAQSLDFSHLRLGDEELGGIGFLLIEVSEKAVFVGLSHCYLGPLEDA